MCDLKGFLEFNDEELDDEFKNIQDEIDDLNGHIRRAYGYLQVLKNEKEKRKNEKI